MVAPELMSKAMIQQRLLMLTPRAGPRVRTAEIRLRDLAQHIGVKVEVLSACAHRRREVDEGLQVQLSHFFVLVERGLLVKEQQGGVWVMKRLAAPAGVEEPPRATIDVSGFAPRINWR